MEPEPAAAIRTSSPSRLAARLVAQSFRFVPRRYRFALALRVARCLEPAIAHSNAWRARQHLRTDGVAETALDLLLTVLTRHGVRYDPKLSFEPQGLGCLPSPGQGWLLLGPHTMLSALFMRTLDAGNHVAWAAAAEAAPLPGARRPARVLLPSPSLPLRIRSKLRQGNVVFAMIDRGEDEHHTVRYELPSGPLRVSGGLLRLALATRTPTFFLATRIERGKVVCRLRPADPAAQDLQAMLDDFASFVDLALRRDAPSPMPRAEPAMTPPSQAEQAG